MSDGSVSPLEPGSISAGVDAAAAAVDPAAVMNPGMKTIGIMPSAAILDPSGSFLYVANSGAGVVGGVGSVSQYSIGVGGALAALAPAGVPVGGSPAAISIYAGTAYVMSNCLGSSCIGSITQFELGPGGELTATGAMATTGGHNDSIGMVLDQAGGSACLLSNLMGIDTDNGALWQFGVESNGALSAGSPALLSIGPTALAQSLHFATLYVLTANIGIVGNGGSAGIFNVYTLGNGGSPILAASTPLSAQQPVSIGMLFLLAP